MTTATANGPITDAQLFEKFIESEESLSTEAQPETAKETRPEEITEAQLEPAAEAQPKAPEYSPNFSYKVMDEEKEFDDRIKAMIKSKDDEDYFRDLFTKAGGLDPIKSKYEKTKEEIKQYRDSVENLKKVESEYETYKKGLSVLDDWISKGNKGDKEALFNLLDQLGVNEQALGLALAERLQWTQDQRSAYDTKKMSQAQQYQTSQYETSLKAQQDRLTEMEMRFGINSVISKPEIAEKATKINELLGGGEALFNEIWQEGYALESVGSKVTYDDVVSRVIGKYSKFLGNMPSSPQPAQTAPKQAPKPVNTIPNIKATAESLESHVPKWDARKESFNDYFAKLQNSAFAKE